MRLVVCRANGTIHPVFKETMIRTHVANLINYLSSKNESRKFLFTNFKQIFILRIILTTFKYLFFVFYLLGSFFFEVQAEFVRNMIYKQSSFFS